MVRIEKESLLDWFNTKQGRKISPPPFGESLTTQQLLGVKQKKTKLKKQPKICTSFVQTLKNKSFIFTYVETRGGKLYKYNRIIDIAQLKQSKNFVSVYYGDEIEKNFSKWYKF